MGKSHGNKLHNDSKEAENMKKMMALTMKINTPKLVKVERVTDWYS
jgi:hypothetical protein